MTKSRIALVFLIKSNRCVICSFRELFVLYWMLTLIMRPILLMFGILFLHLSTSHGCFRPRSFFLNNGLDNTEWASLISDLHTKLRITSMGVPEFATGFPCYVCGRGWTICLLYDGPLSGLISKKNNSGFVILALRRDYIYMIIYIYTYSLSSVFYTTQILPFIVPPDLLWNNFFFIKHFGLSFFHRSSLESLLLLKYDFALQIEIIKCL